MRRPNGPSRAALTTVGDNFTILAIAIPSTNSALPESCTHYLYLRPHEPRDATPADDSHRRSIFISNVPIDSTIQHFRAFFAQEELGRVRVERVTFNDDGEEANDINNKDVGVKSIALIAHKSKETTNARGKKRKRGSVEEMRPSLPSTWDRKIHRSGATALVTFVDRVSMETGLKAARRIAHKATQAPWPTDATVEILPSLGSRRYKAHHSLCFPAVETLQAAVDEYMIAFDAAEAARAGASSRAQQMPDEDGFITVTRGVKVGPGNADSARNEELKARLEAKRQKEEEKREGLSDFYRWQVRARKKAMAGELVKKFEKDRRRVNDMRRGQGGRWKQDR